MKFCPNCGKQLPEGASVCPFCGTAVVTSGAQTQQAAPTYAASSASRPKIQKKRNSYCNLINFLNLWYLWICMVYIYDRRNKPCM